MLYFIVGGLFLLCVILYYIYQRVQRARSDRRLRRDIENGLVPPSIEVGPQPTLSGVANDLNNRLFPRPPGSGSDEPYVPYHRRDLRTSGQAVRREGEEGDPELPTYVESTVLPTPLSPAHTASHPRSSASTERLVLPAYSPSPNNNTAPPMYAPPTPKEPRTNESPIVRTL